MLLNLEQRLKTFRNFAARQMVTVPLSVLGNRVFKFSQSKEIWTAIFFNTVILFFQVFGLYLIAK
jgi:hypothetical protein